MSKPIASKMERMAHTKQDCVRNNDSFATLPDSVLNLDDEEPATNPRKEMRNRDRARLKDDDNRSSPNRPHPALDYPLLYFALKRWPWLSNHVKKFYKFRWRLSHPLQRRLPCSRMLRKIGIRATWGEALLFVPFLLITLICGFHTVIQPNVVVTGKMARYGLIAAIVFGQKNSLLTLCLGIPFDRALYYHKMAGYTAFVNGLLHTWAFAYQTSSDSQGSTHAVDVAFMGSVNVSGSLLLVFLTSLLASSCAYIRDYMFQAFYYFHIVFVAGMIGCAYFHSGILIPCLALFTTGVDMFARKIVMARCRYPRNAAIRVVSESVVELSFPKTNGFDFNPGQYIYIAVPELSLFEFHPFSISSAPKQGTVSLYIRRAGDWTDALHRLALKKSSVSVLVEGPFGNLSVNVFDSDRYQYVVLICGGIGITPMQSVCNQLLYEHANGTRTLENIKLVWVERDPVLMKSMNVVRQSSYHTPSPGHVKPSIGARSSNIDGHSLPFASMLLSTLSPSQITDAELEDLYQSQLLDVMEEDEAEEESDDDARDAPDSSQSVLPLGTSTHSASENQLDCETSRGEDNLYNDDTTSVATGSFPFTEVRIAGRKSAREVFDMRVHLTGREDVPPEFQHFPFVRCGRPQLANILAETGADAVATGHKRVAVLVCSPASIAKICRKACIKLSHRNIRFDYHEEGFA